MAWINELLRSYGSLEYARQAARAFADGARREFETAYAKAAPGQDLDFVPVPSRLHGQPRSLSGSVEAPVGVLRRDRQFGRSPLMEQYQVSPIQS